MAAYVLDWYDEIAHAEVLEERLVAAAARVATVDERGWLETAARRLADARRANGDVLLRALELVEFRALRGDLTRKLQGEAVDAVDGLLAALTALNERSPLIEVIFRHLKPIAMRKAKNDDFEEFCAEIEKRMASSYASRMLADESYEAIAPDVAKLRAAFAAWREALHPTPLADDADQALRDELAAAAERVAVPSQQALFLAEAAFVSDPTLREESRIFERPKKRAARGPRPEAAQLPLPSE